VGRAPRRPHLARPTALKLALAATFLAALGVGAVLAPSAHARWGKPFRVAGPQSLDVLPAQLVFSSSGQAGFGFALQNEDNPAVSQAYIGMRPPGGTFRVPGAQQILGLAFSGRTLELLTAGSPRRKACCRSAEVVGFDGRRFARRRTVLRNLTGDAGGRLIALPGGRLLAVVGTDRGVWVAQSSRGERFGPVRRLTSAGMTPRSLAAAILRRARTFIGWAAAAGQNLPGTIFTASGTAAQAPRPGVALPLAPGHQVDELDVAPGPSGATAAWIESWYDAGGAYHSRAAASDLPGGRLRSFELPGQGAAGVSLAGDQKGDQVLAWKACGRTGACTLWAATRRGRGAFGGASRLGAVDGSQAPVAAVASSGRAVVGWVHNGRVVAAEHRLAARRFAAARSVSSAADDSDLAIAFAPDGKATAIWTQGSISPSLMAASER
jgi:hypothetical protein